jgi:hypothetical protein
VTSRTSLLASMVRGVAHGRAGAVCVVFTLHAGGEDRVANRLASCALRAARAPRDTKVGHKEADLSRRTVEGLQALYAVIRIRVATEAAATVRVGEALDALQLRCVAIRGWGRTLQARARRPTVSDARTARTAPGRGGAAA